MPTFIQSLSSSLGLLQSMLVAGLGQFLGDCSTDDVLEPSRFLKFLDNPKGHKVSPTAHLASVQMKRLPGYVWDSSLLVTGTSLVWDSASPCTSHCMLPSLLRNGLEMHVMKKGTHLSLPHWSGLPSNVKVWLGKENDLCCCFLTFPSGNGPFYVNIVFKGGKEEYRSTDSPESRF